MLRALGEPAFRELEARVLESALAEGEVVATGGGCVETVAMRRLLAERARCVWLEADVGVLRARLEADPTPRPALVSEDPGVELVRLAARRAPWFRELAELTVDSSGNDPAKIAERIAHGLRERTAH